MPSEKYNLITSNISLDSTNYGDVDDNDDDEEEEEE